MKSTKNTPKKATESSEHKLNAADQKQPGFIARCLKAVQSKFRRQSKKKDPDIYPFF